MEFNPKDLTPDVKKAFLEARETPIKFAENFLIDPTLGTPFKATYPQQYILSSKKRDVWVCVHRRSGKALPLTSLVYTPAGPILMGDLSVGSKVITPNNEIGVVTEIFPQGEKELYRITLDDGTQVDSCSEHEWEVYTKTHWKGARGQSRQQYGNVVKTTKEIADNLIYSYSNRQEFNYKLNPINPLSFIEKELPIDPYLFGVLLGDDHFKTRTIASADVEIIETIVARTNYDYRVSAISQSNKAKRYHPLSQELFEKIKSIGLRDVIKHEKHIPKDYLHGSLDQRLWLLRGLMDTNGSSNKKGRGQAEYCSVSKQLASDVADLARSLGCKVRVAESVTAYTKNGLRTTTGTRFRLQIRVPEGIEIFNLKRKVCGGLPERYLRRTIVKVEKLNEKVPMQCIAIDHSAHLFITNNYTPTHNCLVGETLVYDRETLQRIPISEAAHITETLCFDFKTNKTVWAPCTWIESGTKKCLKLNFSSGISVGLSHDHPVFCAKRGWVNASLLSVGDKILAPTTLEVFGDADAEIHEIELEIDFTIAYNHVSPVVYTYKKEALTAFLREFFLMKGRILHQLNCVAFMVWSKDLALGIRHLLLRFGVDSRVDEDGNLFIEEEVDKSQFLTSIGIEHVVTEVRSPRKWEVVTSTRSIGSRPVYDLSMDHPDSNFIGNDLVLHNSYSMTIVSLWHAVTKGDQKIAVFAPSSIQINEFFDVLDKWIAKNPFLQALQDPVGNHKNPQKRSFSNGSTIQGYLMGLSGSIEGAKKGITADVIICFPGNQRVLTNEGYIPIKEIVENSRATHALSVSKEGKQEWKKITKRIKNPIGERTLIELKLPWGSLVCTDNHPILTAEGYVEAQHLSIGDTIFYEKSVANEKREANSNRELIRRRLLLGPNKDIQKCESDISSWPETEGLHRLEIQSIEEVVQEPSSRSGEQGIWKNILENCFNLPFGIHNFTKPLLSTRKETSYSGNSRPTGWTSFSNLVCRRWLQGETLLTNTYREFFSRRESTNRRVSYSNVGRTSNCKTISNLLLFRDTRSSENSSKRLNTSVYSQLNAVQDKLTCIGAKGLCWLSTEISTFTKSLEKANLLPRMQAEEVEYVYDLTIEDNHNFFAEGILVSNCDEAQLFDEEDWRVITPIMRGDKFRMGKIRTYIAGTTPKNPDNFYYEKIYKMSPAETEDRIYIPVDKNPEYTPEMLETIRLSTPLNIWTTEWLLELGEEDTAVFRKSDITAASQWDWEYGIENIDDNKVRFIGVDWDKAQAGTNIAVFQYDLMTRIIQVIYREEVARDRFTYLNACELILELFEVYRPELVITDQGQGEAQWEYLQMESEKRGSELSGRLVKKAFNEKIEVPNPLTNDIEKKLLKPFLVGALQRKMQEHKFRFPSHDEGLENQLLGYHVVKTTLNTTKYSSRNEHVVDCCLFCMYGIWFLYENEFEQRYGGSQGGLKVFNDQNTPTQPFQTDAFWGSIEGPRALFPGNQIPRTSIDSPFDGRSGSQRVQDFFAD